MSSNPPSPEPASEAESKIRAILVSDDEDAWEKVMPIAYGELYRIAKSAARGRLPSDSLHTTALLGEFFAKKFPYLKENVRDGRHLMSLAARAMQQIVIDRIRHRQAQKRQPTGEELAFDQIADQYEGAGVDPNIEELLEHLEKIDPRAAEVFRLRFFAGLAPKEVADAIGISTRTESRLWQFARAWLRKEIDPS